MEGDASAEEERELAAIRRELSRGTTELVVLALLVRGACYGYDLLKQLERLGGPVLEIKEGTLYPLLHRLENDGHIVGEWKATARERPRKYYGLTPKGTARLMLLRSEWVTLLDGVQALLTSLGEESE